MLGIGRVAVGTLTTTSDTNSADGTNAAAITSAGATGATSAITHIGIVTAASGGTFVAQDALAASVTLAWARRSAFQPVTWMSHSRWRSAAVALGLLMAVTINTIPAQAGELVRMLVTVGVGGENTANRNWWRLSSSTGSVSADSDVEIDSGLTINRILWHTSDQLRFFKSGSGSFSLAITAAGVLSGKSVLFAVNDAGDAIDAQFDIDTASISAITNRIGFNTDTAQTAAFNTVVTGGLVNIVISDPPGAVAEVFVDTAADVTAGAPDVTAAAEKEIPAPTFDTGATDVTAGAATAEAAAEKVGLAQEFHDTAADVEAGAPASRLEPRRWKAASSRKRPM